MKIPVFILVVFFIGCHATFGSKLVRTSFIDKDYIMVEFKDGDVTYVDDGLGKGAFETHNDAENNIVITYGLPLDVTNVVNSANWSVTSADDPAYANGLQPVACFRKSKLNGMAQFKWNGNDFDYAYTMEHTIFLKLPKSMEQGKSYVLHINENTNTHLTEQSFVFDIFTSRSEAIHANLVGFMTGHGIYTCDLYCWLGDGGGRDYKAFEGKKAYLYDIDNKQVVSESNVAFWQKSAMEQKTYNQTSSDVWKADFPADVKPGNYRFVIEGVGCSADFTISSHIYLEPFKLATRGFFYMRIGQDSAGVYPVPRRPLYIPGKSPENTRVIITTMHPYHPQWKTFSTGDVWDRPEHWAAFAKPGNPENNNAYGGHSDALDWDRHLGHISIIYDMLLPFVLTKGALVDDNLGIAESGNGIPDILDEARNEVDFWLRLRDGKGYSHGITVPGTNNTFYQAENTAMAAWANAANCAMLSRCFQLAGLEELMNTYRDSAVVAYTYAGSLKDPMLEKKQDVGDVRISGMELRLLADAFLYAVTGDQRFEKDLHDGSRIQSTTAAVLDRNTNELWAVAGYLTSPQEIHYKDLFNNMKASIIQEARLYEANYTEVRPSRRGTDELTGYFKTEQNMHRTMIAHAMCDEGTDKAFFEKAMILEADWGLGRNPLNIIQMTTATTSLENKRSIEYCYTSGRDDGAPGMHPGHTPYLNTDDWGTGLIMSRPKWMTDKCYPAFEKWPKSAGYFKTPYVWAHSEFTPQQTMRGKMALYGYLYGISKQ